MSIISNCTESAIKDAAKSLISGNLVAFATETVYGLGADATNKDAVAKVYEVKGRPVGHPLIVHISSIERIDKWAREIPEYAIKLARNFWPGPMTLILPRTDLAKDFITGGQDNVGIRVPSHTLALALLKEFETQGGLGVAAPSANRFGAVSPTTASAVNSELGKFLSKEDQILDGGDCEVGIESTIIDCRTLVPSILRPGAVTNDMVNQVINYLPKNENLNLIRISGSFKTHYAPKAEVVLNQVPNPGDGLIALSMFVTPNQVIRLASPQNTKEFAKVLYESLRDGDQKQIQRICIYLPIGDGIAVAIRDRLEKASSKNSL